MRIQIPRFVAVWLPIFVLGLFLITAVVTTATPTVSNNAAPTNRTVQFFLDSPTEANLIVDQSVRIICFADGTGSGVTEDFMLLTDEAGRGELPNECRFFSAMQEVERLPSGKGKRDAMTVYRTNFAPNATDIKTDADSEIVLLSDNYLILFNVVVSLAWEPDEGSNYVDNLMAGLRRGSSYLYDASEGRMAFGEIRVEVNGRSWDEADIRIKAANDFRPAAYVGGIVPEYTVYHSLTNPEVGDLVYAPGAIFLGRHWTRNGAFYEPPNGWAFSDSYKTIVHEWAHYALFLYDEYLSDTGENVFCTLPNQHPDSATETAETASLLEWHYNASELWLDEPTESVACEASMQFATHAVFDWDTLDIWDEIYGLSSNYMQKPENGPEGSPTVTMINPLFGTVSGLATGKRQHLPLIVKAGTPPATPIPPTPDPVAKTASIALRDPAGQFGDNGTIAPSQVYLMSLDESSNLARRILHQGTFLPNVEEEGIYGKLDLLGAYPDTKLRVFFDRYQDGRAPNGENYVFLDNTAVLNISEPIELKQNPWPVDMAFDWKFADERLTTMIITISSVEKGSDVTFQLCVPEAEIGCFWDETASSFEENGRFYWQVAFNVDDTGLYNEVPLYGIVRAFNEEGGELINWYQVAGGVGPAHMFIDAPMVEGAAMVNTPLFEQMALAEETAVSNGRSREALFGPCGRVIYSPAINIAARLAEVDSPDFSYEFVSQPLDIDIMAQAPGDDCNFEPVPLSGDRDLVADMYVTLFYNQDWSDAAGTDEATLQMLRFDRTGSPANPPRWDFVASDVTFDRVDTDMNRLSIEFGVPNDGIFVLISQVP